MMSTRGHGRILASVWRDPDWRTLTLEQQHTYMMLLSQPDLGQAGLVPLSAKRWSNYAAGDTPDAVRERLHALEQRAYVVVDEDTEEVLVRTLIRNDRVWQQPYVMQAAVENARSIESPKLKAALLAEADRLEALAREHLSVEPGKGRDPRSVQEQVLGHIEALRVVCAPPPETPPAPPDKGPGKGSETLPEGSLDGSSRTRVRAYAPAAPSPSPSPSPSPPTGCAENGAAPPGALMLATHNGQPVPAKPLTVNQRAQAMTRAYHELVPLSPFTAVMKITKQAIECGRYSDEQITGALLRLGGADPPLTVTANTLRRELDGPPGHTQPVTSGALARVQGNSDALRRARERAAQRAAGAAS